MLGASRMENDHFWPPGRAPPAGSTPLGSAGLLMASWSRYSRDRRSGCPRHVVGECRGALGDRVSIRWSEWMEMRSHPSLWTNDNTAKVAEMAPRIVAGLRAGRPRPRASSRPRSGARGSRRRCRGTPPSPACCGTGTPSAPIARSPRGSAIRTKCGIGQRTGLRRRACAATMSTRTSRGWPGSSTTCRLAADPSRIRCGRSGGPMSQVVAAFIDRPPEGQEKNLYGVQARDARRAAASSHGMHATASCGLSPTRSRWREAPSGAAEAGSHEVVERRRYDPPGAVTPPRSTNGSASPISPGLLPRGGRAGRTALGIARVAAQPEPAEPR